MREEAAARRRAEQARRRTEQAQRREARGYQTSVATVTGDPVQKPVKPRTELAYGRMIRAWDLFLLEHEGHTSPLDIVTAKIFLKWYCDGRKGRIPADESEDEHECEDESEDEHGCENELEDERECEDEQEPETKNKKKDCRLTQNSGYTCWKSFMSAWHRRTNEVFPQSVQDTMETLCYGGDNNWLNLRTTRRPGRNFTLMDFDACALQLWQNDWYDFRSEMYRVNLHHMMLMHACTSARSAEYVMNLRYRDTMLYQVWFGDCPHPRRVIDLRRNHTKGLANLPRKQPEHLLYELVDLPFYYNTVLFFIAGLLALNGLRDIHGWEDLCAMPKPPDRDFVLLTYKHNILSRHVFPRYNGRDESGTKPATSLVSALGALGHRTGFRDTATPGAIRREALLQVDRYGYSINERMRHADHISANTYGGFYQNSISTVDGQATYFGIGQQLPALHELFRSFSIQRDYQFRPEITWELRGQVQDADPANDDQLIMANHGKRKARQKTYERRRQQKDRLVQAKRWRQITATTLDHVPYESDFQQARKLMPERDRLATELFETGSLWDVSGVALLKDLVNLYASRNSDTHCAQLNSSASNCDSCGVSRAETSNHQWWRHTYHCRKQRQERMGQFSEFCFLCFVWINNVVTWKDHTKEHRQSMPLKCNLATFRGTVLRPGFCPDCDTIPQFLNTTTWRAHTDKHILGLHTELYRCSHSRCKGVPSYTSLAEYAAHRSDVHLIPPPHGVVLDSTIGQRAAVENQISTHGDDATDASGIAARSQIVHWIPNCPPSPDSEAPSDASTETVDCLSPETTSRNASPEGITITEDSEDEACQGVDVVVSGFETGLGDDHFQIDERSAAQTRLATSGPPLLLSSHSSEIRESLHGVRHQDEEQFQGALSGSVKSKSTMIELVIPSRPKGWESVPLAECTDHSHRMADNHTACEEVSLDEPQRLPRSHFGRRGKTRRSKRSMRSQGTHVAGADGNGSRVLKAVRISEIAARRRNAITEMHARIRERQRSHLKATVAGCA